MRALVSTDLHSSPRAASAIRLALSREAFDVHICLGDIITFRPMEYLEDLFASPPIRTLTLPGNTDPGEARARLEELGLDLHFRRVEVEGVSIGGAGGCPPPPFRTAFIVEEEEYASRLPDLLEDLSPARGILDRAGFAVHVGSHGIRDAIATSPPKVVVSGHIHEATGVVLWDWGEGKVVGKDRSGMSVETTVGRTLFMNPGPAKDGRLGLLEVDGERIEASTIRT
jgi:Icc-related predicted phosphoesterase